MIASGDAAHIKRLLKQLARDSSTENTIAFFADNGGMLQACKKLLTLCHDGNKEAKEWLHKECTEHRVSYAYFLQEAGAILQLFGSNNEKNDHYQILGLAATASRDEVKRAYRQLSARYHPDTASHADGDTTERFIQINKAYHALTSVHQEDNRNGSAGASATWHYGGRKNESNRAIKKSLFWAVVFAALAIGVSLVVSWIYSRKVMLATLHQSSGAFVPPAKQQQSDSAAELLTYAEKMKIAEAVEKKQAASRLQEVKISVDNVNEKGMPPEQPVVKDEKKHLYKTVTMEPIPLPSQKPMVTGKVEAVEFDRKKIVAASVPSVVVGTSSESTAKKGTVAGIPEIKEKKPVAEVPPKKSAAVPDMQQRIDAFFAAYCRAYGDKNLVPFARFFDLAATENGKPILSVMDTYSHLFETTKEIVLQLSSLKWEVSSKGIIVDGGFKIDLVYQNDEVVHGRGKIDFLLIDDQGKFQISAMNYSFD